MQPVSQAFKDAVYAPARTVVARVTFDISDVTAHNDVSSIASPSELPISRKAQLHNKIRNATNKIATLELNRFKLDGSFSFADDVALANNGEVGYVSADLCEPNGMFSPIQIIEFTFSQTHNSAGISLTFDPLNGEYATDLNVSAYDASDMLIQSVDVLGNSDVICVVLGQFLAYRKIVITISRWSVGSRRLRLQEVDFGVIKTYEREQLISANLIEEMDLTTGQLPSPEFRFTVDNLDRAFNILNPTGIYKYLQQRQQVIAEMGVLVAPNQIEYVPIGSYLLWEWTSEEGSITASFTTRTNLDLMANYFYERTSASSKTLATLAVEVFAICGIANYSLDPSLSSITTNSLAKRTDCKTMLQMIAIAGCCNIYVTRDNVITLKQISLGTAVDRVDFDNVYNEPKIDLEKTVKQVEVTYWTNLDTSGLQTASAAGVEMGDVLQLKENTLINTVARAGVVASWLLAQKQLRTKQTINWRGNPAYELGDLIAIENSYGADINALITRNELTYQGYLQARTEAKGAAN